MPLLPITSAERGEFTAHWLEGLADSHIARAVRDITHADFHRGVATLYRARASDVRAGLDLPDLVDPAPLAVPVPRAVPVRLPDLLA